MNNHEVKWFHCFMRGIPQLINGAGTFINLLDALLINGFGQTTVVSATAQNGVVTLDITNSETFEKYSIINIAGDDQLKGDHRVIESTNNYIKIALDIPNQVFTGTFYVKYAPLGWNKVPGTGPANTALYTPKVSYSDFMLYINDTHTQTCQVKICRGASNLSNISDFNTLIDFVPKITSTSFPFTVWVKSTNSINTTYFIIGDGATFYQHTGNYNANVFNRNTLREGAMIGCGEINRYLQDDILSPFIVTLHASLGQLNNIGAQYYNRLLNYLESAYIDTSKVATDMTFLGNVLGEPGNDVLYPVADGPLFSRHSGSNTHKVDWSVKSQGLELIKILATSNTTARGEFPGIYAIPYDFSNIDDLVIMEGSGELENRLILFKTTNCLNNSYNGKSGPLGVLAFDITGPWR